MMQIVKILILVPFLFACDMTSKVRDDKCKMEVDELTGQTVYIYVDQKPEYPGGYKAVIKFFTENYEYPEQEYFQAKFQMEFIVNEQGEIIAPRIKGKEQEQLTKAEKEAIRVLEKMSWNSGECNRIKVPVKLFLLLNF